MNFITLSLLQRPAERLMISASKTTVLKPLRAEILTSKSNHNEPISFNLIISDFFVIF